MRMLKLSGPLAALAVAFSLGLLGAAPASASTDPYYDTNPYADGCASGTYYVANTAPITLNGVSGAERGGYVQIWFSQGCGTNWGRVVAQPPSGGHVIAGSQGSFTQRSSDGKETDTTFVLSDGSVISGQIYAPSVTACSHGYVNTTVGFFEGVACA